MLDLEIGLWTFHPGWERKLCYVLAELLGRGGGTYCISLYNFCKIWGI